MNLVLLGPPASGKGTCSAYLHEKYHFVHISMGDILRDYAKANTKLANIVRDTLSKGKILDENITAEILYDYLKDRNLFDNLLLDGYPRGLKSVELMKRFVNISKVIVLDADFELIKKRILNRITCPNCSKNFSKENYKLDKCDECGSKLVKRSDDNLESLTVRMQEYQRLTIPVIEHYEKLGLVYRIDSKQDYKSQLDKLMEDLK